MVSPLDCTVKHDILATGKYSEFSVRGLSLLYPARYHLIAAVKSFPTVYDIPILSGYIGMSYPVGKLSWSHLSNDTILSCTLSGIRPLIRYIFLSLKYNVLQYKNSHGCGKIGTKWNVTRAPDFNHKRLDGLSFQFYIPYKRKAV